MENPPVRPEEFDYHDRSQLTAMYNWAGSTNRLASYLTSQGIAAKANTLNAWRDRHGIPIVNPAYRMRGEEPPVETSDASGELLEYLRHRKVPPALPPTAAVNPGEYATCLIGSDLHYPYHHEAAWEVFLGLADRIKPTEIVINGDAWDFAQIGKYLKNPQFYRPFYDDIEECRRLLARIPDTSVRRFIVGNHEEGRWQTYLWSHCPDIASHPALTMEALLGLTEMGWIWQPYEYWVTDSLIIFHGDRHTNMLGGGSAMSARKEMLDMGCSGITGHTHHAGSFFRADRTGYRVWYEIGCLCDWRKMQAAGVTTKRTPTKAEDWHLACALVRYRPGHSAFRVELIPIIDDGERTFCIYQDEEIAA